jgi:predicted acyltransferase (DUF342 family)
MKIIDENYGGLIRKEGYYLYDGNLIIEDNCRIIVPLRVSGSISVSSWLIVRDSLSVGGSLSVGKWLIVRDSLSVGGSLDVGKWLSVCDSLNVGSSLSVGGSLSVGKWIDVREWLIVGDSLDVGQFKTIMGVATTSCILISSRRYIIALDTHLKIGCEFHTYNEWRNFTERELLAMADKDSVKWFKENKNWLLSFEKKSKEDL